MDAADPRRAGAAQAPRPRRDDAARGLHAEHRRFGSGRKRVVFFFAFFARVFARAGVRLGLSLIHI